MRGQTAKRDRFKAATKTLFLEKSCLEIGEALVLSLLCRREDVPFSSGLKRTTEAFPKILSVGS